MVISKRGLGKLNLHFSPVSRKRGSGHLEMIVSFSTFAIFTIFLLFYLSPAPAVDLSNSVLESFEDSFINLTSEEVEILFVSSSDGLCHEVGVSGFGLEGVGTSVINSAGFYLDSSTVSGGIFDVDVISDSAYVYFSDEFITNGEVCADANSYELGDLRTEVMLVNSSLEELEANYSSNYEALKTELGLSSAVNFAFYTEDGDLNAVPVNRVSVDTYTKLIIMDVVYADGTIEEQEVYLQVW